LLGAQIWDLKVANCHFISAFGGKADMGWCIAHVCC
jgi:hypothetical protein